MNGKNKIETTVGVAKCSSIAPKTETFHIINHWNGLLCKTEKQKTKGEAGFTSGVLNCISFQRHTEAVQCMSNTGINMFFSIQSQC